MQFLLCLSLLGVIDKYCSDQVQSLKKHQWYWVMSVFMTANLAWRTDHESIHWLYFNKRIEYMQIVRRWSRASGLSPEQSRMQAVMMIVCSYEQGEP
jgi:hypothetical protein